MHKEAQQAAGGPTSIGATSEEGAHPQLSSGYSTAEVDHGISTLNDFIPEQQGMDKGTQNYLLDHIFAGTNPSVFVDKTKSKGDGLKTAHTDLGTNMESRSDEISKKIMLEDLSNLMQDTRSAFLTLDSPRDEPIIVSDKSKKEETKRYEDTHTTPHDGPKDTSIPHPPSPKSLEQQKAKAKAEVAFLKARLSYPDINQLTELLATSLNPKLSKLLALHDFACCLLTELKELPSKIVELSGDVKELKKNSKGKEVMSSKDAEDEETESDSEDDHANPAKTMTESSKQKKLKKFSFITEVVNKFTLLLRRLKSKKGLKNLLKLSWPN
ncbi:hypothetical protein Tco_0973292 [Tanacetum coccineum]